MEAKGTSRATAAYALVKRAVQLGRGLHAWRAATSRERSIRRLTDNARVLCN